MNHTIHDQQLQTNAQEINPAFSAQSVLPIGGGKSQSDPAYHRAKRHDPLGGIQISQ